MHPGRKLAICAALALLLPGCGVLRPGIPDADPSFPPPPKTEACQIWVRVDNGPWRCHEREKVLKELCKATPQCSPL